MFDMSNEFDVICSGLLAIQNKFIVIKKTSKGHLNDYASYPDLIKEAKPILSDVGILLLQPVTCLPDNQPAITTMLICPEKAQWIRSVSPIQTMTSNSINAAQQAGGGISYMKRYALAAMLAWATGDYDFDEKAIDAADKKAAFILESFERLTDGCEIQGRIMSAVDLMPSHKNKQKLYTAVKDTVLPEFLKDPAAGENLLADFIRELS